MILSAVGIDQSWGDLEIKNDSVLAQAIKARLSHKANSLLQKLDIEQVLDDHEDKIQEIIEEDIIRYGWDYEQTRAFQEAVKNRIEGQVSQMMERAFKAPLTAEEQQRELYEKLKAKFEGDEWDKAK